MKMNDSLFIKEHRTNILPLRWFANICESIAHFFLSRYLYWDNLDHFNKRSKLWAKLSTIFYAPYMRWGTVYVMSDKFESISNMAGAEWSDYDEDGIPYWDYLWHEDPVTGDAWRLVKK